MKNLILIEWSIKQLSLNSFKIIFICCRNKLVLHTNYRFISLNFTLYAHKQKSEILVISNDCSICDGSFLSRIHIFLFVVKHDASEKQWRLCFSLCRKCSYKRPSVKRGSGEKLCWSGKICCTASCFMMEQTRRE